VVHFTNFIRHFKRPGFWSAKPYPIRI